MEGRILWLILRLMGLTWLVGCCVVDAMPRRILLDTDVDTEDIFALFYVLKQNRSEFDHKAVTVNANAWSDAGHAVNHIYDMLYLMDHDDIAVGVGGDGGILSDGAICPNAGGYLPLIEQGSGKYSPLQQPTAQKVMIDTISAGCTTEFATGAHKNLALFLMTNAHKH